MFILEGQLSHLAGSLLPAEGIQPVYAQLYIHDSEVALQHHLNNTWNWGLDCIVLSNLQDMLETLHPSVQLYKLASEAQCRIALYF
jgi:hypothetical protein